MQACTFFISCQENSYNQYIESLAFVYLNYLIIKHACYACLDPGVQDMKSESTFVLSAAVWVSPFSEQRFKYLFNNVENATDVYKKKQTQERIRTDSEAVRVISLRFSHHSWKATCHFPTIFSAFTT